MKNKCKTCGYIFRNDDGNICPECFSPRILTNRYIKNEKRKNQKKKKLEEKIKIKLITDLISTLKYISNNKCNTCGYFFRNNDGNICPECHSQRVITISGSKKTKRKKSEKEIIKIQLIVAFILTIIISVLICMFPDFKIDIFV